jgi:DNA excision repair protein ERCC-2
VQVEDFFAYESFRPNQRELAVRTYQSCLEKHLFLTEAMSGFGKTAAVLSGVISAAREKGCKVIYTCRTKRQILRVVDEISLLQRKQPLKAASMFSKFDYCLLKRSRPIPQESFGWYCGFNVSNNLCSYFLNVALLQGQVLDRAVEKTCHHLPKHSDLLRESESIHVCPYELTRLAVAQAEVIVVPYHYLFDYRAKPVLLDRNAIDNSRTILVVDEAHNIRDFLRSTLSAALSSDELANAASEAESLLMSETSSSLRHLNKEVQAIMSEAPGWYIDKESFIKRLSHENGEVWLHNLIFELTACSEAAWHSVTYDRRLPFLTLKVGDFLNKLLLSSSEDTVLTKWNQTLGLVNTNPTKDLPAFLKEFYSTVLISATINPSALFRRSLGIDKLDPDTYMVQTAPLVTVLTVVDTGVTTKYKSRTPEMYDKIANKIVSVISSLKKGVGVFTPAYSVLEPVRDRVSKALPEKHIVSEARGLSNQEANDLMESFRSVTGSVLFAVQGGRFSEGEDFARDVMDATVIVGLSLPPPSPQLYAEYAFLKRNGEPDSYLMLSLLPALRKAFQAAGRHLRNPGKRGLVFMLDRRFDSMTVTNLMPSWLKNNFHKGDFAPGQIELIIHDFFWPRN